MYARGTEQIIAVHCPSFLQCICDSTRVDSNKLRIYLSDELRIQFPDSELEIKDHPVVEANFTCLYKLWWGPWEMCFCVGPRECFQDESNSRGHA
jgi:hypothetical protein